jgi:hypothetical protein
MSISGRSRRGRSVWILSLQILSTTPFCNEIDFSPLDRMLRESVTVFIRMQSNPGRVRSTDDVDLLCICASSFSRKEDDKTQNMLKI